MEAEATVSRYCYRCRDCLSVFFADCTQRNYGPQGVCEACNGPVECMGRVESTRLKWDTRESVCDARCTSARGPHCDCPCGGINHGSQRTIQVTRDAGAVPRFRVIAKAQAIQQANEWRAALEPLYAELAAIREEKRCNRWVSDQRFYRMRHLERLITDARDKRTHAARMKILAAAQAECFAVA